MANFLEVLAAVCAAPEGIDEETKEELRKEFEEERKSKYNRGTVIAAMAESGRFDSWDMNRVTEACKTPEHAEAAVGLIRTGRYDSFDIRRILESF